MGCSCPCHTCPAKDLGIFSSLNDEELLKTRNLLHQNFYKKHQIIFHEDNPCQGFYIMKSGRAKLVKSTRTGRQVILKLVNPGGIIGEHAVFENSPYAFTAEAIEDSEICFISKEDFLGVLKGRPEIALKIMSILSGELRAARAQVIDMALKEGQERMAALIMSLADEYGTSKNDGILLGVSLTRGELAEMVGVSQETAIRIISEFRETGLIKTDHRQITVLNEKRMRMVASGEQMTTGKKI